MGHMEMITALAFVAMTCAQYSGPQNPYANEPAPGPYNPSFYRVQPSYEVPNYTAPGPYYPPSTYGHQPSYKDPNYTAPGPYYPPGSYGHQPSYKDPNYTAPGPYYPPGSYGHQPSYKAPNYTAPGPYYPPGSYGHQPSYKDPNYTAPGPYYPPKSYPGKPLYRNPKYTAPGPSPYNPSSYPSQPPTYPTYTPKTPSTYPPYAPPSPYTYPPQPLQNQCAGLPDGKTFPVDAVCFAYFVCNNQEASYRECELYYRFDEVYGGCVSDKYCYTACPDAYQPDSHDIGKYYVNGTQMSCSDTTYWDQRICTCQHRENAPVPTYY